jgi:hypothetical protein
MLDELFHPAEALNAHRSTAYAGEISGSGSFETQSVVQGGPTVSKSLGAGQVLDFRLHAERSVRRIVRLTSFARVLERAFDVLTEAAVWSGGLQDLRQLVDRIAFIAVIVFRDGSRPNAQLVLRQADAVGRRVDRLSRRLEEAVQSNLMSGEAAALARMITDCRRRILDESVQACNALLTDASNGSVRLGA